MLFKISLKPNRLFPDGLIYDNQINQLRDARTNRSLKYQCKTESQFPEPFVFKIGDQTCVKHKKIKTLELSLGLRCNLHCSYCSQQTSRKENDFVDLSPAKIEPFFKMLKDNGITITDSVYFWGGEPLVYWKTLKRLIVRFREEFPNLRRMWFATNGTLLTKDKVNFLKENGVSISVSTDGTPDTFRGIEVEGTPHLREVFEYAAKTLGDDFRYHASPHQGSANVITITENLKKKTPSVQKIELFGIVRCQETDAVIDLNQFKMDEGDRRTLEESTYEILTNPDRRVFDNRLTDTVNRLIEYLAVSLPMECINGGCISNSPVCLVCDMDGNTYSCHCYLSKRRTTGHISGLEQVRTDMFTHFITRPRCTKCHVAPICRGICPMMLDDAVEISCPNHKAFYSGIFRAALFHLLGVEVTGVEALNPEQKPAP